MCNFGNVPKKVGDQERSSKICFTCSPNLCEDFFIVSHCVNHAYILSSVLKSSKTSHRLLNKFYYKRIFVYYVKIS